MIIERITNPDVTYALVPWYVPADKTIWQIGAELYARMVHEGDKTFVLVAREGSRICAFLAAYVDDDRVHIWQAKKEKAFRLGKEMFSEVLAWTEACGLKRLTLGCTSKRLRRLYRRKYGFASIEGPMMEKTL